MAQVYKNKYMTGYKSDVSQDDQFQRPDIVQKVLFVSLAIDENRVTQFLSFSKDGELQILVTLLYARVVSSTLTLVISRCLQFSVVNTIYRMRERSNNRKILTSASILIFK